VAPTLKVYGFSRVNEMARGNPRDLRVLWALEELGMPYEIVGMGHPNPIWTRRSSAR
jgi:glutathione S-transferase